MSILERASNMRPIIFPLVLLLVFASTEGLCWHILVSQNHRIKRYRLPQIALFSRMRYEQQNLTKIVIKMLNKASARLLEESGKLWPAGGLQPLWPWAGLISCAGRSPAALVLCAQIGVGKVLSCRLLWCVCGVSFYFLFVFNMCLYKGLVTRLWGMGNSRLWDASVSACPDILAVGAFSKMERGLAWKGHTVDCICRQGKSHIAVARIQNLQLNKGVMLFSLGY